MSRWQVSCTYSTSVSAPNRQGHMTVTVEADTEADARIAAIDEAYATAKRHGAFTPEQLAQFSHVRPGRVEPLS